MTTVPPQLPARSPTQQIISAYSQNEWNNLNESIKIQSFWKYHVLKLSPFKFYLTTNPDNRHRYARPGPGYYIHLQFPNDKDNNSSIKNGFRLTFRQQDFNIGDINNIFTIEKVSEDLGGNFIINFKKNEYLDPISGLIKNSTINSNTKTNTSIFEKQTKPIRNGSLLLFSNYKYKSLNSCQLCPIEKSMFNTTNLKLDGVKLAKSKSIYFIDTNLENFKNSNWYNPVLSLFRHCERNIKSKVTKKLVTKAKNSSSFQLFSSTTSSTSSYIDDSSSISDYHNDDEEGDDDIADESMFYIPKDGLFDRHPQDDSPNDYKFGWITIYDKENYFSKDKDDEDLTNHNWQVLLGITLASAIETHWDSLIRDIND